MSADSKSFIPFHELEGRDAIMVDGLLSRGLVLSHWKEANFLPEIQDDTSAGIVINAIKQNIKGVELPLVTATHFDVDGFIGVWSLFEPALALQHEEILKQAAIIGDFREFDSKNPAAIEALKLVCWINKVEAEKFYSPFESDEKEIIACQAKFDFFIPLFKQVLLNVEHYKLDWETEFNLVMKGCDQINSGETIMEKYFGLGLVIIETLEPVHYCALYSHTNGFDTVLSIYGENRYELEYKYTTWVDISSRPTYPRISFEYLTNVLNEIEKSGYQWHADKIKDTGPILRIENSGLSKAERFANPYSRKIYSSTISKAELKQIIISFYKENYMQIEPRYHWKWSEIYELNKNKSISVSHINN